jgi:hypothetical protein
MAPILLIKRWGAGFWSDVEHVVGQLVAADILARIPVVHWGISGPYADGKIDTFGLYFQPLSDLSVDDLTGSVWPECWTAANITDDLPFAATGHVNPAYGYYEFSMEKARVPIDQRRIKGMLGLPHDIVVSMCHESPQIIAQSAPPTSIYHQANADQVRRIVMRDRIKLRRSVADEIERFWQQNLQDHPVLAIHLRGSSKVVENINIHRENDAALPLAAQWLAGDAQRKVFLISDSEAYHRKWSDIFGASLVTQSCRRTDSEQISNFLLPDTDGWSNGLEILIDTYCAAKCERFIGNSSSNVSNFVAAIGEFSGDAIFFTNGPDR